MELWDVLDEYGNKTGKTIERGQPLTQGEYFLIVDVWIVNGNGEILISKRTSTANPDPDKWQPTCGCAVMGDDSITTALRETKEELGIALDPQNGKLFKRLKFSWNAIVDVWLFYQNVDINTIVFQPDETVDAEWASGDKVRHLLAEGDFINNVRMPYIDELMGACGI